LLPFGPELSVFSVAVEKLKNLNCDLVILPVVLYGCETWSLILREEHILRVFENTVLRRLFGPQRDEVTGGWRKLHNEELRDLYSSPSIIRTVKSGRTRWAGHVAGIGRRGTRIVYWCGTPRERRQKVASFPNFFFVSINAKY
jgi:hypothetical protein